MRTKKEVIHAFNAVTKLSEGQKMCMQKLTKAYEDMATDIIEYCPDSADRTSAIRKLLDSKNTAIQAITHHITPENAVVRNGATQVGKTTEETKKKKNDD